MKLDGRGPVVHERADDFNSLPRISLIVSPTDGTQKARGVNGTEPQLIFRSDDNLDQTDIIPEMHQSFLNELMRKV